MPRQSPFVLGPNESVLWEGKIALSKMFAIGMILAPFVVVGVILRLASLGYFLAALAVDVLVVLPFLKWQSGIRFYVTSVRIVRTQNLYWWSRKFELPLESIVEVKARRVRGTGYVGFEPPPGHRRLFFGPLKDDPERIREIALRAQSNLAIRR